MRFPWLVDLVPDEREECCLMDEGVSSELFPIYSTSVYNAVKVLSDCFAFEYYLVAKDKRWLICENHQGVIVCPGEQVTEKIREAAA